jgi:hypothetical protein
MDKETLAKMFGDIFSTCTILSEEDLARYAELEIAGREPRKQLPKAAAHLDDCADCTARYTELLTVLEAETSGKVSLTSSDRPFNLQFLPKPVPGPWDQVEEKFYRLVAEIPIVIQRAKATFGSLPTILAPYQVAVAVGAEREVGEIPTEHKILRIPHEPTSLVLTITPGPAEADGKSFTLILKVEDLSTGEPLGKVRMSLYDSQAHLLKSKTTKADGQVVFQGLVGGNVFRCKRAGETMEFAVPDLHPSQ